MLALTNVIMFSLKSEAHFRATIESLQAMTKLAGKKFQRSTPATLQEKGVCQINPLNCGVEAKITTPILEWTRLW